ncbi:N-acetylneuraminate synthase [Flavobacteriaceae bacterium]|nr:N-acetylneuraminate synthase [Flavobacteriaceae bacterium]
MLRTYIIAEAGVNHNGRLDLALELVQKAKDVGADCIKFQTFKAEKLVTKTSPKAKYQLETTNVQESQFSMLKGLELPLEDYITIKKECERLEIDFISTPYDYDDVDFLDRLGVSQFKVASSQLTEVPFLKYIAGKGKPIIISTGMANLSEVFEATQAIKAINEKLTVLQCTTNYPSHIEEANILAMQSIKEACKVNVGYSDHVKNNYACYAATAMGAEIIEKHFTIDTNLEGPDHSCSLDPEGFKALVYGIRQIEASMGNGVKMPTKNEAANTYAMRRSIVSATHIKKGQILDKALLSFKRPANGIAPKHLEQLIGRKLKKDIEADQPLNWNDFE